MGDHAHVQFLAGVEDQVHPRVVREKLLQDWMDLETPGAPVVSPVQVFGALLATHHSSDPWPRTSSCPNGRRPIQSPAIEVRQTLLQQLQVSLEGGITRNLGQLGVRHEHVHHHEVVAVRGAHGLGDLPYGSGQLAYLDVLFSAVLPDLIRAPLGILSGLPLRQDVHVHINNRRSGHDPIVRVDRPGIYPARSIFTHPSQEDSGQSRSPKLVLGSHGTSPPATSYSSG